MRWSNEERAFAVEAYFSNRLSVIATQRAFRNRLNVAPREPCSGPEINCYMGSGKPSVRHDEEVEYIGLSDHLKTLRL